MLNVRLELKVPKVLKVPCVLKIWGKQIKSDFEKDYIIINVSTRHFGFDGKQKFFILNDIYKELDLQNKVMNKIK